MCAFAIIRGSLELLTRKAIKLQAQLGTRCAAGYLRNRGVDIQVALQILASKRVNNSRLPRIIANAHINRRTYD